MTLDNALANNVFKDLLKGPLMLKDVLLSAGDFSRTLLCTHLELDSLVRFEGNR